MAYKQKYKGLSRMGKGFSLTINEKDLNSEKSASSQPSASIGVEGQGGKDYENLPRDAKNPEGQGGIDYEAKDYKPKKQSPLNAVGAHSMKSSDYASHLASSKEHKTPSDKVIAKRKKEGKKVTGHISDKQPTNTPPKDGMSRKSGSYLSDADVVRKQKKADKKFSKVSAKNSDKKNLRKAKAGLKAEKQIRDKKKKGFDKFIELKRDFKKN
tara:strand:+ start:662 stop:1297 length:636 start_codon:yes stop_codon:yes gene_type:complete